MFTWGGCRVRMAKEMSGLVAFPVGACCGDDIEGGGVRGGAQVGEVGLRSVFERGQGLAGPLAKKEVAEDRAELIYLTNTSPRLERGNGGSNTAASRSKVSSLAHVAHQCQHRYLFYRSDGDAWASGGQADSSADQDLDSPRVQIYAAPARIVFCLLLSSPVRFGSLRLDRLVGGIVGSLHCICAAGAIAASRANLMLSSCDEQVRRL
ncbi:hypothetical protein THAOC_11581 [Thalassiosira oceanica]|uniref:Uncharacterized protein n=1 Tax=Thalassiosira oceanica TaxID=159749 RepID=K0SPY7_THAOC|nr:hypothetical protein THAOC_11581 [Thalassiosira oceanica]|eukprot:EJK67395.1 hypothetical protein THAOC_11581 [Thalassiosira oceanica]